ncbi:hypothetical protein PV327_003921 [Microctonus hyperodae]|uniref:PH domain-containing protein n=1 Tax=Microctonus hyperodae TaxID=165561 RepID=A0AA39G5C9_MICHY|nr:hypothetical protein PV327_003921 [Microctonus hyperodae]
MEVNQDTFTGRMLERASSRRNLNGAVVDTTSEHLRRKHSVLCAIDDELVHQNDNCTETMHHDGETMKIATQGNSNSIINSLTAVIDDLDLQINSLGIHVTEMMSKQETEKTCDEQIYPILTEINFDTVRKNKKNQEVTKINNDKVDIYATPKATRRHHKPNLESTRKSPRQGLDDKTASPQIDTSISTIQVDSPLIYGEKSPDFVKALANIPDEVEQFLENALGDELYNSTVTYTHGNLITHSHINASELMSESRTPFLRKIKNFIKPHGGSSKNNSTSSHTKAPQTFDRTAKLYRSLSQRVKKLRTTLTKQRTTIDNTSPIAVSNISFLGPIDAARNEKIENLLRQVRIQHSIMNQAKKALEVCHSNKEFIGSREEVESQRLLLLAHLRKRVIIEEIRRLSSPDHKHESIIPNTPNNEYAEVKIENIQLNLRKALHEKPGPGEIHDWYVVAVLEGTNVWGTSAMPSPIDSLTIDFPGFSCLINNLTPKLKITIEVYVLKLITGVVYHHEEKYHITNGDIQNRSCPSPTKLLKKVEHPLMPRARHPIRLASFFTPSGYVELTLGDLILASPWPLSALPPESMLQGTIDLKLNSKLHLSVFHQGFLNYGNEAGGSAVWNRKWCALRGHTLMFWNYPKDQEDKKPPLVMIDLIYCISNKIAPINRSLCAKPRTLLIETVRARTEMDENSLMVECHEGCTIIRHLLSYDSTRELVDWMSKLNHVVTVLREWNINTYPNTESLILPSPMVSEL